MIGDHPDRDDLVAYSLEALEPREAAEIPSIRPWRIVLATYEVVIAKGAALLHAVSLPTALMMSTVLIALKAYFVCLASYWSLPSVRVASIAISSVVIGVILSALTGSIAAANVARPFVAFSIESSPVRLFAWIDRFPKVSALSHDDARAIEEKWGEALRGWTKS